MSKGIYIVRTWDNNLLYGGGLFFNTMKTRRNGTKLA
jgi:hypothetical protein